MEGKLEIKKRKSDKNKIEIFNQSRAIKFKGIEQCQKMNNFEELDNFELMDDFEELHNFELMDDLEDLDNFEENGRF